MTERNPLPTGRRGVAVAAAALLAAFSVAACDRDAAEEPAPPEVGELDRTTLDKGWPTRPPGETPEPTATLTLPSGATVIANPMHVALYEYLQSDAPAGRRFDMRSIRFVPRADVRQDPDTSLTTLAAILTAYPDAHVRVEVIERAPASELPHERAEDRSQAVAQALVQYGVDASRVSSLGRQSEQADEPQIELVVTSK